jgi:putative transposase
MPSTKRKSSTSQGKIYFWTATIHKWNPLLYEDSNKDILIASLKKLSDQGMLTVFAFVIMPTHIHLIFRQNKLNGKETPKASFMKYTAHILMQILRTRGKADSYRVNMPNKRYQVWQRDSLGIEMFNRWIAKQKLGYIHANPVKGKWLLAKDYLGYHYSSARFYENGEDEFGFMQNLYLEFDGD